MLSVIIATKDRAPLLARALCSLQRQRVAVPFEVIVVDNGSSDDTASLIAARRATAPFPLRSLFVGEPNRAAARNAGIAAASQPVVVFVDDDVWLPEGFLAAHAAAQRRAHPRAVSGPILNVPSYEARPRRTLLNYSNAFFCTCNVSVPRASLLALGGFDARFNLYGWEDTELGLRLRRSGVRRAFAWNAYLYHIKPPAGESFDVVLGKTVERATMAVRLLERDRSWRTRLATGAYAANLWRARVVMPRWALDLYGRLANDERFPRALRRFARSQLLDGAYTATLQRLVGEARR